MKRWIGFLLGLPVLFALAVPAMAQPGGMAGKGREHGFIFWKNEKIVKKLALTPEQIGKLDEIDYQFKLDSLDPATRLKRAKLEMDRLFSQSTFSAEDAARLSDEISAATATLTKLGISKQIAVRQVLSADQWSQLEQSRQHRMRGKKEGDRDEHKGGPSEEGHGKGMMRMHRQGDRDEKTDQD